MSSTKKKRFIDSLLHNEFKTVRQQTFRWRESYSDLDLQMELW